MNEGVAPTLEDNDGRVESPSRRSTVDSRQIRCVEKLRRRRSILLSPAFGLLHYIGICGDVRFRSKLDTVFRNCRPPLTFHFGGSGVFSENCADRTPY